MHKTGIRYELSGERVGPQASFVNEDVQLFPIGDMQTPNKAPFKEAFNKSPLPRA